MSETQTETKRLPKKGRSPGYPAIDLQVAIRRAEAVYLHEKMHPAPVDAIVGHWGYKSHTSGVASVQYASLKKFGLLTEEGSGNGRQGQLTSLAYAILHNPDESERVAAIQKAALTPPIHREMWEQYGSDLPSNANLRYRLVTERGFTENGAEDFVKQYKATIAFAMKDGVVGGEAVGEETVEQSEGDGYATSEDADEPSSFEPTRRLPKDDARTTEERSGTGQQPRKQAPGPAYGTRIPIPLIGGQRIFLEGEFPITEAAWMNFQAVLQALKPGLVVSTEQHLSLDADYLATS